MLEREIVLLGKTVAELCKVIVFVDEGNIEPGGAGVAVFAVDTFAERVFGREGRDGGIVARLRACFKVGKHLAELLFAAVAGKDGDDAGLIERVGDALRFGEGSLEGGLLFIQQLAAAEGFHDRDADALSLTAAVKIVALGVFAEAEVALAVVVDGIDAEHEHIDELHVKNAVGKQRGMRRKAEMVHHALRLQIGQVF